MKKEKLLTVIVPIYNVEKFLDTCLSSLETQTDKDFKVILVNDGSKDKSSQIAKKYVQKNPNMFTYMEQKNKGLGAARNLGLRKIDTTYVTFLDSDDWWPIKTMERIRKCIEKTSIIPDLIFTCPTVFNMTTNSYSKWRDNDYVIDIFNRYGETISAHAIQELYGTEASVCRLVIKYDILKSNNFSFPEGVKWEDVVPHFQILNWSRRCVLLSDAGFTYRINSGSQITSSSGKGRLDIVPVFAKAFSYAIDNNWLDIEIAYIFKLFMEFVAWFLKETRREVYPDLVEKLHDFVNALPNECYKNYCKIFNPGKKEKFYWHILKSNVFYKTIKNQFNYKRFKEIYIHMNKRGH